MRLTESEFVLYMLKFQPRSLGKMKDALANSDMPPLSPPVRWLFGIKSCLCMAHLFLKVVLKKKELSSSMQNKLSLSLSEAYYAI